MPPNVIEPSVHNDPEIEIGRRKEAVASPPAPSAEERNGFKVFLSFLNLLAHILIGATVSIALMFAFRNGLPLGATPMHIVLCVIGYQLLMAESILSLSPHNGWTSSLKLLHKRRIHWILQIMGSGLAIVGSFIKILDKTIHWNTLHGQFALVALVFTSVSLFNGLASLYAYELSKFIPGNLSKLSHICFGIVAFSAASICLCYGFEKNFFRNWATVEVTYTIIAFTAAFTAIIIVIPLFTFINKSTSIIRK